MTKQESLDKIFKNKSPEKKTIEETKTDKYILKFDGCSKGNPGPAGAGAVIYKNEDIFWKSSAYVGKKETNNVAEYVGMLIGLNEAVKKNIKESILLFIASTVPYMSVTSPFTRISTLDKSMPFAHLINSLLCSFNHSLPC